MFSRMRLLAVCALVIAIAGCAGVPIQALSDARQTIRAAENAGPVHRAPDALADARAALALAEQRVADRDFRGAAHDADTARRKALDALARAQDTRPN